MMAKHYDKLRVWRDVLVDIWSCLLKRDKVKSRQIEPLHLNILAKSKAFVLIFTFIYTSDKLISLNILHVSYLTVRVIRITL